jgi:hypothetical protein
LERDAARVVLRILAAEARIRAALLVAAWLVYALLFLLVARIALLVVAGPLPRLAAVRRAFALRRRRTAAVALILTATTLAVTTGTATSLARSQASAGARTSPLSPLPKPKPLPSRTIRTAWLSSAGAYVVEPVAAPRLHMRVDLGRPPAGIGHTTECSFEGAVRAFRRHYAPHFLVGRDRSGTVRILQFVPLGEAAATTRNLRGGVETNRWARAQIEVAAYSKESPWSPDKEVLAALGALLEELEDAAGIPLSRPFPDLGSRDEAGARRASGKWGSEAGWFNHAEVPENDHWDMGGFEWARAFAAANQRPAIPAVG